MDWQIPLLVSAIAFAAFLAFKMRPAFSSDGRASATLLKEVDQRLAAESSDTGRAKVLAAAAEACVGLGQTGRAATFFLRAMKADPSSAELVARAATAFARRPTALETLLWKRLGAEPWTGANRGASIAALRALGAVYAKRRRHHMRAKAIDHALALLESPAGH